MFQELVRKRLRRVGIKWACALHAFPGIMQATLFWMQELKQEAMHPQQKGQAEGQNQEQAPPSVCKGHMWFIACSLDTADEFWLALLQHSIYCKHFIKLAHRTRQQFAALFITQVLLKHRNAKSLRFSCRKERQLQRSSYKKGLKGNPVR